MRARCGAARSRGSVRARWTAVAVGLAALCALGPWLVAEQGATAPLAAVPANEDLGAGSANATFASRAGYSASYLSEVGSVRPAAGAVPVDVTFNGPLSDGALARAEAYFAARGVSTSAVGLGRLALDLNGTATAVGAAFGTELLEGTYQGAAVRFPATPPTLPAELEGEIAGVVGLSSGFTAFSFDLSAPTAISPDDQNTVTPALAREFYGFSTLYNLSGGSDFPTNLTVAVVLWGDGVDPSDIRTFLNEDYPSTFPTPTINYVPVAGAPASGPGSDSGGDQRAAEELTLDIEWAVSMAPGATIDAVYAPAGPPPSYSPSTTNLTAALQKAVALGASVVSMSFGTPDSSSGGLASSWESIFSNAEANGVTFVAATGDTGGDTNNTPVCSGTPAPEYPSTSPYVIAAGGTNVSISRDTLTGQVTGFSETGWGSSGGGYSSLAFNRPAPSWQEVGSAAAPISAGGGRGVPDVSSSAADNYLYFEGTPEQAGGTSFASPLWAGLVADLDAKWGHLLGFVTPSLYHVGANEPSGQIGEGLVDVTGGANCVGTASTGWDPVTGWGSPRAAVLFDDLLGSFVSIDLTLDRATIAPGGTVGITAQVTNRTSGAALSGVQVVLSVSSDTSIGPCTGTFSSASPTSNASGWVSARLSVPWCYLGQHAYVNASVTTVKLYGTSGVKVDVNLLGFAPGLVFLSQAPWAYVTYVLIVGGASILGAWIGRPREPSIPAGAIGGPGAAPPGPPRTPPASVSPPVPPPTGVPPASPVTPSPPPSVPAPAPSTPPGPPPPSTGSPPGT